MSVIYWLLTFLFTFVVFQFALRAKARLWRLVGHALFVVWALGLSSHRVPWISNYRVFEGLKFSNDSLGFSLFVNFDKPIVGLVILLSLGLGVRALRVGEFIKTVALSFWGSFLVLIPVAMVMGYMNFDFKLPEVTWVFALNNLFIVCMAEEAFFRRYLQQNLVNWFNAKGRSVYWGVVVSSVIFGVAHFAGGLAYVVLATLAGLFYGWAYHRTGRVEAGMLAHFFVNMVHFIFFSYPALA